ncbi:hypothetical protein GRZ55_21430 [Chelativorans sp. ZYF759]|uniref:hypothetical protein n=1 Tax=Chelativorans sp. ZYF759 TaxID=2692213 RepID=UPI00145C48D6|nr:hypothetical protein [Chelativorans sp. ZYF759]NMG41801.1 hypothetical protein [Chelativorans sp. ZYF759]
MSRTERPAVRPHDVGADKQAVDLIPVQAARAEIAEYAEVKGDETFQWNRPRTRIEGTTKFLERMIDVVLHPARLTPIRSACKRVRTQQFETTHIVTNRRKMTLSHLCIVGWRRPGGNFFDVFGNLQSRDAVIVPAS